MKDISCSGNTTCYSYFSIVSAGKIVNGIGYVADEKGIFQPDDITQILGIQPFAAWASGTPRKIGGSLYTFSRWDACKQTEPAMDAKEQCRKIVRELRPHLSQLQEIKQKFDVEFALVIVSYMDNGESPILGFDWEIIEFCYLTNTEIVVDLYASDSAD